MPEALDVFTSTAVRGERMGAGIVIRDIDGQTVRVLARPLTAASREEAAYRALLRGLWTAKGLGVRRVRVYTDNLEVGAQLQGAAEVPPTLVGLYLQTKAMLNAYRWSDLEWIERDRNAEAALAAMDAIEREPIPEGMEPEEVESLPLWLSADQTTAGKGSPR